jgi:hypothetical protein
VANGPTKGLGGTPGASLVGDVLDFPLLTLMRKREGQPWLL